MTQPHITPAYLHAAPTAISDIAMLNTSKQHADMNFWNWTESYN